ncbi:MetQ/NlpA family ABC transporter substrate-binding protein [Lederbergia citrea]|uniref:MetQ/NlpA family ABC transporter substrate-binding protein n=1 Tax=Lederbergia citrea TaxID=2833581 RepID=UPI001BCA174A|nr:MetQ/NlpA family ABC transporter substrate-binding protein [Lederbergia citrea]MBS4178673.1 hypothetical protein [Lederbergia citrea]
MRRIMVSILILAGILSLAACSSGKASGEKKEIKIGATAGPYSDQIKESIKPLLEKEGYSVKIVEFNDYIQPNKALDEGDIDVNVYQNPRYLEQFNKDHEMDLVYLYAVPSAPIAIYSEKHTKLSDVKAGVKVTLPNDPVNMARSLQMMEQYGWIKLNPEIDATTVSEKDIIENNLKLNVVPLEAGQLPRSLGDSDFAFINGNFALASGLKLDESVAIEKTPDHYLVGVAIKNEDKDKPFVAALQSAYHSKEFLEYTNKNLVGFVKPSYQTELEAKK